MKRIILILLTLLLILTLAGCKRTDLNYTAKDNSKPTVVLPNSSTAANVNGNKQPANDNTQDKSENKSEENNENKNNSASPATDNITAAYIANTSSKKFHKSTCSYAKSIKAENLATATSREQLINDGYSPCKRCNP